MIPADKFKFTAEMVKKIGKKQITVKFQIVLIDVRMCNSGHNKENIAGGQFKLLAVEIMNSGTMRNHDQFQKIMRMLRFF